jgi:hypothetical protein
MPKAEPPQELPARLLNSLEWIEACRERDFAQIFQLVKRAGVYPALIARRCELTPSRVGEVMSGQRVIKDMYVIERVADGLRVPGHMLGLARRDWETGASQPAAEPSPAVPAAQRPGAVATDMWVASSGDDLTDPEFVVTLIKSQLPQHYKSANYFGARQPLATAHHHAQTIGRLLEQSKWLDPSPTAEDWQPDRRIPRLAAQGSWRLPSGCLLVGPLHGMGPGSRGRPHAVVRTLPQEPPGHVTEQRRARYWPGAAQRVPNLTPKITALAAQQEAAGYALQRNPRAALASGQFLAIGTIAPCGDH